MIGWHQRGTAVRSGWLASPDDPHPEIPVTERDQGAAGRLSGASAARARGAAATAEQPRGAGSAVEGPGPTPRCCRGCGLRQRIGWRLIGGRPGRLKDWIIRYSDGKADESLVERWINIPRGAGLIHFYNPALVNIGGYSTFMCQGTEPSHPRIFDCERIGKSALDLGIATSLTLIHCHDQQQIRETILETPPPSGFAVISDDTRLPGISEAGRQEYRRFLAAPSPRAFAISSSGHAWAWNSSLVPDAAWRALARCAERAQEQCQLYAVDDAVVWTLRASSASNIRRRSSSSRRPRGQ
jgi:hypothetical protein